MSGLYQLLFTSIANEQVDDVELYDILKVSAENNARNDVTGLLVYRDGIFLEKLEGEKHVVLKTYQRILNDRRHRDVTKLEEAEVSQRQFTEYKMCFESEFERTLQQNGNYMNRHETKSLLLTIDSPSSGVMQLLELVA